MNSGLEAARMDTMKGYSSRLQVESEGDVRSWLSICSEECAGFTPEYDPVRPMTVTWYLEAEWVGNE